MGGENMMDRRVVLKALGVSAGLAAGGVFDVAAMAQSATVPEAPDTSGTFVLPPLPYAYDALEPYVDATTMHLHHGKHHQAYVNNLNAIVATHPELRGKKIEQLLANLDELPDSARTGVRNNGGGHFNHSFLWPTLGTGSSTPTGNLAKAIERSFGSQAALQDRLTSAAMSVFGSGWAWLAASPNGTLLIETTPNQDTPLSLGHTPVLGVDVWEHAYYLKYQNRRAEYLQALFHVVSWGHVSERFSKMT